MSILEASEKIKQLYRTFSVDEEEWQIALENFSTELQNEESSEQLEACVLADVNWELSVGERLNLIRKAKSNGANSIAFLKDYYGYLAAHLDPGSEVVNAEEQLQELMKQV